MEFDKKRIKTKIAISKIKDENDTIVEKKIKSFTKTISAALATILLSTGIVFAGTRIYEVYEKVWREPESYTYDEMISQIPGEVTEEEKEKLITEDEAEKIGFEILRKLGYENQTINRIELKRGYEGDVSSYYMVKTKWGYEEGLMVMVNANGGSFLCFEDMDLKYKHFPTEILTDEEISKIAIDIYNKLEMPKNLYKLSRY